MKEKKDEAIKDWEDNLLTLSDSYFFNIIRAYFGSVETPFNKHNLLERLTSFLRDSDVRNRIINALSYEDVEVLTVISYLECPHFQSIARYFFDLPCKEVLRKLENLNERLLIYMVGMDDDNTPIYDMHFRINPILKDCLTPLLNLPFLMPYEYTKKESHSVPFLTPAFFCILYSYIRNNKDVFKKDGTIKKKVATNLARILPVQEDDLSIIEDIFIALLKLHLIECVDGEMIVIEEQWKRFATLTHLEKVVYLCISKMLENYELDVAIVLCDFLNLFQGDCWYEENEVYKKFYLVYKKHFKKESDIVRKMEACFFIKSEGLKWQSGFFSIKVLDVAVKFGLLLKEKNFFAVNKYFFNIEDEEHPLLISSTFEATLNQNASFSKMLPILIGLKPLRLNIFASFEFNRTTCEKFFQLELNSKDIILMLESVASQTLPQNVRMAIEQWYQSYNTIGLYHGYVLAVDEKKRKFFERGTALFSLIKKEIADGVYLLAMDDPQKIDTLLKKAGLDFIFFQNKSFTLEKEMIYSTLKKLCPRQDAKENAMLKDEAKKREEIRKKDEADLIATLERSDIDPDDAEVLQYRIKRRVVLKAEQVSNDAIEGQVRIATGRDFIGKLKLLEEAKANDLLVEITLNAEKKVVGRVYNLWKNNTKANCVVELLDNSEKKPVLRRFEAFQILKLKVIESSIFS